MYGLEIIVSIVACVLLSFLGLVLARRSLIDTDIVTLKAEVKPKIKAAKKSPKLKIAKKESSKPKQAKKIEDEIEVQVPHKSVKKDNQAKAEVSVNVVGFDRVLSETSTEWKKVSKPSRKIGKKETKVESKEDIIVESTVVESESSVTNEVQEAVDIPTPAIIISKKSKKSKSNEVKVAVQKTILVNPTKTEEVNQEEIKVKPVKEKVTNVEIKQEKGSEEMDLRRRIGELMSELDKQKSINKEENKTNIQTINQLNKELDSLKIKMKNSQSNEEKLTEELKKKNASFGDFRQQYVIVQSELTKNIVQVQSLSREKDKLESRIKLVEETNKTLKEKNDLFDEVNLEREKAMEKLAKLEEEYKLSTTRYNELLQNKEKESTEKINQLQIEKQKMQERLVHVQADLIDNNSKLQNVQQELLNTKNKNTDTLNANVLVTQQQSSEATIRDKKNCERIAQLLEELDELKTLNMKFVVENQALTKQFQDSVSNHNREEKLTEELNSLKQELSHASHLLSVNKTDFGIKQEIFDRLTKEFEELKSEKDSLKCLVEQNKLKSENVVDSPLISEKETQMEIEAKEQVASLSKELSDVNNLLLHNKKDLDVEKETCSKLIQEIIELKAEKNELFVLVEQYKTGLKNTEYILSNLQTSVNEEEDKWRESLLKSEAEADKCKKELETAYTELTRIKNLRADKTELNFAYHCVDKSLSSLIDEMEARMNHFESSLETVIQERDNALAQVHIQMNGTVTKEQSVVHMNNINDKDNDSELTKIKEDLINQVELNKSLEIHCNKYRSLIEIGKDALEAEKVQVKSLKEELKLIHSKLSTDVNHDL